jgi:hypothetical protein
MMQRGGLRIDHLKSPWLCFLHIASVTCGLYESSTCVQYISVWKEFYFNIWGFFVPSFCLLGIDKGSPGLPR